MGWFKKKKKERLMPLPEFPKLPEEPSLPAYEKQLISKKKPAINQSSPLELPEFRPLERERPLSQREPPQQISMGQPPRMERFSERPLFVKIEKYRSAVNTIESIKGKINEAEAILSNLKRLKEEEENELTQWQSDINEIKERLLKIDKSLFEV